MASGKPQLHVVFGRSAAETLQQALEITGREGTVVAPYDDFSFGPINSNDAKARAQWVEDELGYSNWRQIFENSLPLLTTSIEAEDSPIAWISPNNARSVAGFLWWLPYMDDKEFLVLDVPDLGLLGHEAMAAHLDYAKPLSAKRRANSLALWSKLQEENAPLRVLRENELKSAPVEYFDAALLGHATREWQKMAMIVGGVLCDFGRTGTYQTGDLVLGARLAKLAETGTLEWRGDLNVMARCELRLPNYGDT